MRGRRRPGTPSEHGTLPEAYWVARRRAVAIRAGNEVPFTVRRHVETPFRRLRGARGSPKRRRATCSAEFSRLNRRVRAGGGSFDAPLHRQCVGAPARWFRHERDALTSFEHACGAPDRRLQRRTDLRQRRGRPAKGPRAADHPTRRRTVVAKSWRFSKLALQSPRRRRSIEAACDAYSRARKAEACSPR